MSRPACGYKCDSFRGEDDQRGRAAWTAETGIYVLRPMLRIQRSITQKLLALLSSIEVGSNAKGRFGLVISQLKAICIRLS